PVWPRQAAATSLQSPGEWSFRLSLRLAGKRDHLFELAQLLVAELVRHAEKRACGACRRAVEEHPDDVRQRRLLGHRVVQHRTVEKATIGIVAVDEALVLEALEHCAHRRAAQLDRQRVADIGDGERAAFVENVDDLAFARRQLAEHHIPTSTRRESSSLYVYSATFVA